MATWRRCGLRRYKDILPLELEWSKTFLSGLPYGWPPRTARFCPDCKRETQKVSAQKVRIGIWVSHLYSGLYVIKIVMDGRLTKVGWIWCELVRIPVAVVQREAYMCRRCGIGYLAGGILVSIRYMITVVWPYLVIRIMSHITSNNHAIDFSDVHIHRGTAVCCGTFAWHNPFQQIQTNRWRAAE